jgi:hypothetical protein
MTDHGSAVRTGLIKKEFQTVRQHRRRNRDQHGMVAGAPSSSLRPREASQPAAARTRRTFSVKARAISSGAGPVLRAILRATATSALVGRTVIGKLDPRRKRLDLSAVRMARRIGRAKPSNAPPAPPVHIPDLNAAKLFAEAGSQPRIVESGTLLPRSRLGFLGGRSSWDGN